MKISIEGRLPEETPHLQDLLREIINEIDGTSGSGGSGGGTDTGFVSVVDYGAVGDGVTDDTTSIQAALSSTEKGIVFPAGMAFLTNELTSTLADRTIDARGAIIKLKNAASGRRILTVSGDRTRIEGGSWNGNKANQTTGTAYDCWAISFESADDCEVSHARIYDVRGIGIKAYNCNRLWVHHCRISNVGYAAATTCHGVYMEATGVDCAGNRVESNYIDMSTNGTLSQPILLTSSTGYQLDWVVSNNYILGSTDVTNGDSAICIGARGNRGLVSGNTCVGGSMGFSEGGDDTVISGNVFKNLAGTVRWAIEPTGKNVSITGNTAVGVIMGVSSSTNQMDHLSVTGNTFICDSAVTATIGVQLQTPVSSTGRYITVSGNTIAARQGVRTTRDVTGLVVSGNSFKGPGSGTSQSAAVYVDTPEAAAHILIQGNYIAGYERGYVIYSASATTFTNLYALGNIKSLDVGSNTGGWSVQGSAVLGAGSVIDAYGIGGNTAQYSIIDQLNNVKVMVGISGTPEGAITAGIGSMATRKDGGASTTLYIKESGTGNTGWVAK